MTMAYIIAPIAAIIPAALISYSAIQLLSGNGKKVTVVTYVISAIFLIKLFLVT